MWTLADPEAPEGEVILSKPQSQAEKEKTPARHTLFSDTHGAEGPLCNNQHIINQKGLERAFAFVL